MDYPWERLEPALSADSDKACLVTWADTGQNVSGQFRGSYEIRLSNNDRHMGGRSAFVFAHEVGHLIDRATFDTATRDALAALFHVGPFVQIGHFDHDHPDVTHPSEKWVDASNAYTSRINECYADQFVAAFAPRIWAGDESLGWNQHWPRFVHWTENHAEIRRLTLQRNMTP